MNEERGRTSRTRDIVGIQADRPLPAVVRAVLKKAPLVQPGAEGPRNMSLSLLTAWLPTMAMRGGGAKVVSIPKFPSGVSVYSTIQYRTSGLLFHSIYIHIYYIYAYICIINKRAFCHGPPPPRAWARGGGGVAKSYFVLLHTPH